MCATIGTGNFVLHHLHWLIVQRPRAEQRGRKATKQSREKAMAYTNQRPQQARQGKSQCYENMKYVNVQMSFLCTLFAR